MNILFSLSFIFLGFCIFSQPSLAHTSLESEKIRVISGSIAHALELTKKIPLSQTDLASLFKEGPWLCDIFNSISNQYYQNEGLPQPPIELGKMTIKITESSEGTLKVSSDGIAELSLAQSNSIWTGSQTNRKNQKLSFDLVLDRSKTKPTLYLRRNTVGIHHWQVLDLGKYSRYFVCQAPSSEDLKFYESNLKSERILSKVARKDAKKLARAKKANSEEATAPDFDLIVHSSGCGIQ